MQRLREAADHTTAGPGAPVAPRFVWRSVPGAALALILAATIARGVTLLRGFFYIDDFAFTGRAMEFPLLNWSYLSEPYNSHLMPGAYAWVWLTTHVFPLSWPAVAFTILALQAALSGMVYLLLTELFGRRSWIIVPLAVVVLSPISLPAGLWWAAAVNQLPQQLAMATALFFLVRYFRTGRRWFAVAGPLAVALGLLFSEKSVLAVPLVAAVAVVYFTAGSLLRRVSTTLTQHWLLWVAYAVVSLPYLAYYLLAVPSPLRETPVGHDVADLVIESIFRGTVPGVVGGPWSWAPVGFAGALADPSGFMVILSVLVVGVVIGLTTAWWRGAAAAWLILLGYAVVNLALLAASRATVIGPVIGAEYRYQTDLALVAGLALGLASMPVAGSFAAADVQRLSPRWTARAWLTETVIDPMSEVGFGSPRRVDPRRREMVATVVVLLTLGTSAGVSWARYDPLWVANPARSWVNTVRDELPAMPAGTVLAQTVVPEDVAWGFIYPYNSSHRVLAPILEESQMLRPGHATAEIAVPDESGHLRRAAVAGVRAVPGPEPECGWRLGGDEVTIPLVAVAPDADPVIRIGFIATDTAKLTVRINGRDTAVPVGAGLGARYLVVDGPVREVTVLGGDEGPGVCSDDITVGAAVPLAGTTP